MAGAFRAAGVADVIEVTDAGAAVAIATARGEASTVAVTGSFLHLNDVRRALRRRQAPVGERDARSGQPASSASASARHCSVASIWLNVYMCTPSMPSSSAAFDSGIMRSFGSYEVEVSILVMAARFFLR